MNTRRAATAWGLLSFACGCALADYSFRAMAIETQLPVYPVQEERAGHGGLVVLRFKVNETGVLESVLVDTSSGFPRLDDAALAAGRNWKFKRGESSSGKPEASETVYAVLFEAPHGKEPARTCAGLKADLGTGCPTKADH